MTNKELLAALDADELFLRNRAKAKPPVDGYAKLLLRDAATHICEAQLIIREYLDAEEQDLLVRLPVKRGDVLWTFYNWPSKAVYSFCITSVSVVDGLVSILTDRMGIIRPEDIGKAAFLTRAEAAAALKEAKP